MRGRRGSQSSFGIEVGVGVGVGFELTVGGVGGDSGRRACVCSLLRTR